MLGCKVNDNKQPSFGGEEHSSGSLDVIGQDGLLASDKGADAGSIFLFGKQKNKD